MNKILYPGSPSSKTRHMHNNDILFSTTEVEPTITTETSRDPISTTTTIVHHPKVTIRSKAFGVYVQLDGRGITEYRENLYRDTVHTAGYPLGWETFKLHYNNDGTVSFECSEFPGVYLSLDGYGVDAGVGTDFGGWGLAAQFGAYAWEKYYISRVHAGTVTIESAAFRGRYIRVDGNANAVNVQGVAREWEQFEIMVLG